MKLQRIVGRDSEELHPIRLGLYPCRRLPHNLRLLTGRGITADANLPNSPLRKKNNPVKLSKGLREVD